MTSEITSSDILLKSDEILKLQVKIVRFALRGNDTA